jgi:putative oxidoreductase
MKQSQLNDIAVFLLRLALGAVLIAHSLYLKLFVFTLPGAADFFVSLGLPAWFAYAVFVIEAVTGIMLILGIQTRWVALLVAPVLAGATWAHWANGWMFSFDGGGWEYPLYLTLLAIVQFIIGDGAYSLVKSRPIPSTIAA